MITSRFLWQFLELKYNKTFRLKDNLPASAYITANYFIGGCLLLPINVIFKKSLYLNFIMININHI